MKNGLVCLMAGFRLMVGVIILVLVVVGIFIFFAPSEVPGKAAALVSLQSVNPFFDTVSEGLSFDERKKFALDILDENPEWKSRYDNAVESEKHYAKLFDNLKFEEWPVENKEDVLKIIKSSLPMTKEEEEQYEKEWEEAKKTLKPVTYDEGVTIGGVHYSDQELSNMTKDKMQVLIDEFVKEKGAGE